METSDSIQFLKRNTTGCEHVISPLTEVCMATPLTRSRSRCTSTEFEQYKDNIAVWINSLTSQEVHVIHLFITIWVYSVYTGI